MAELTPEFVTVGTSINVGTGITPSTANGDIVAGDGDGTGGTGLFSWDTSTGVALLRRDQNATTRRAVSNQDTGSSAVAGLSAASNAGSLLLYSYSAASNLAGPTVYGFSSNLNFYVNSPDAAMIFNVSGGGHPGTGWRINSENNGRHFRPSNNNALDLGASGTRVRTGYFGTSVVVNNGTNSWTTSPTAISYADGTRTVGFRPDGTNDEWLLDIQGTNPSTAGNGLGILVEDAVDDDVLGLYVINSSTGTNARATVIVGNDEGLSGKLGVTSSTHATAGMDPRTVFLQAGITGESLLLAAGNTSSGITLSVGTSFTVTDDRIRMDPAGHWRPIVNNSIDIGTASLGWRTGYFGTSVVVGATTITPTSIDSTGALTIGGTGATSLAIGRSGVTTDFPSGSTVDFTGATVTGLSGSGSGSFGFLNVGGSTTSAVADGDFAAGDGTNVLFWDANESNLFNTGNHNGPIFNDVRNNSTGTGPLAYQRALNNAGDSISIRVYGSNNPTYAFQPAYLQTNNTHMFLCAGGSGTDTVQLRLGTGGTEFWTIGSASGGGHLFTETDNATDIGLSGALRPRTLYLGTALNVGNGIAPSTANGDITAGDGTREMFWDASDGTLAITGTADSTPLLALGNQAEATNAGGMRAFTLSSATGSTVAIVGTNQSAGTTIQGTGIVIACGDTTNGATPSNFIGGASLQLLAGDTDGAGIGGTLVLAGGKGSTPTGSGEGGHIAFYTASTDTYTQRWSVHSDGHWIAGKRSQDTPSDIDGDNLYDIGSHDGGTTSSRPRTLYLGTALNVGNGIAPSTANGDITAGDGTREMTWDASAGKLEINTSGATPDEALSGQIVIRDSAALVRINSYSDTLTSGAGIALAHFGGSIGSRTQTLSGMVIGTLNWQGTTGAPGSRIVAADIKATAAGNFTGGNAPTDLSLWTTPSGGATSVERLRVSEAGGVTIGDVSTLGSVAEGDILAGDGTNKISYDASDNLFVVGDATGPSLGAVTGSGARFFGSGSWQIIKETALTNTSQNFGGWFHRSTGTPLAGFGANALFLLDNHLNIDRNAGMLDVQWETNPATEQSTSMRFGLIQNNPTTGAEAHTSMLLRGSDDTLRIEGGLEVGTSAGTITGAGDIVAGDGTREMVWDASVGSQTITTDSGGALNVITASNSSSPALALRRFRGTIASPTGVVSGDIIGGVNFQGKRSDAANFTGAAIRSYAEDTWAAVDNPASIRFSVVPDGAQDLVERVRISPAGGLTVGDVATLGAADEGDVLAGDGTRELFWDASAMLLSVTEASVATFPQDSIITSQNDGNYARFYSATSTAISGPGWVGRRSRGTLSSPSAVADNDALFEIYGQQYNGSGYTDSARIRFRADGAPTSGTSSPGKIDFLTTASGATSPTSRMLISAAGGVTIGDVATLGSAALGDLLVGDGTGSLTWDASAGNFLVTDGTSQLQWNSASAVGSTKSVTAATNTTQTAFQFGHESSGTPAAGLGVDFEFAANSLHTYKTMSRVTSAFESVVSLSEISRLSFEVMLSNTITERLRVSGNGGVTIGDVATLGSAALGDIVAGDGTREMVWDSSAGTLAVSATNSLTVADGSLTQSSGTLVVAASAGVTQIRAGGANQIEFNTNGSVRWEIGPAGHLTAITDNTYDIGASGATRPRTGYFGTALNVGNGITPSTANGDIVAGDGTREMAWDASEGSLTNTEEFGTALGIRHATVLLSGLSGTTVTASNALPDGALILGVTTRVTTTITGATTYSIGDGTDAVRWGSAIGLTAGTTSSPTDFQDNTTVWQVGGAGDVVLTANGSDFTAGAVRISITYMTLTAPTS